MKLEAQTGTPAEEVVAEFFRFLYDDEDGYVYLACKGAKDQQWDQHFFQYPTELGKLVRTARQESNSKEVYVAPALFNRPEGTKDAVKGARVFWTEFDGNFPDSFSPIAGPSLRVRTSESSHQHCYWKTSEIIPRSTLEAINRGITYHLDADASSWDCTQVLRVPTTINHKRGKTVELVHQDTRVFSPSDFEALPELPPLIDTPIPESIPAVEDVVSKYVFKPHVWKAFRSLPEVGQRSTVMMHLGYAFAEMQMTNEEILSLLLNVDSRWKKFSERSDQLRRLTDLITKARAKHPLAVEASEGLISLGLSSLLATQVKLEWVVEGFLEQDGYLLNTGPSGVGKTQVSLYAASSLVLGKPFLGIPVLKKNLKIGFFSLEMGLVALKYFLQQQVNGFTPEELIKLEENFRIFPLGQPLYLTQKDQQARIERVIQEEGLDGIIVDSLGSTTDDELSQEKPSKNLMDWNDKLRQELGIFTWYIHHHRKATSDNRKPNKLADVYGSHYLTSRATSVVCLWPRLNNMIEVISLKVRLSQKEEPFLIQRDKNLMFTRVENKQQAPLQTLNVLGVEKEEPKKEEETLVTSTPDNMEF